MADTLDGIRVCMIVTNDVSRDARVQKEAATAAEAGAEVIVIGVGDPEQMWTPSGYELRLVEPMKASDHRLRAVRIAQNLWRERAFHSRLARAARQVHADIIHCNDLVTLAPGVRAAKGKSRVVYDAHELSTEGGGLKDWQRWLLVRQERRLAPRADAVLAVSRSSAEWLAEHRCLRTQPTVVMNGAAVCSERPGALSGPVRLFFQGQLFFDRNVEAAVRCMPYLRGRATLTLQGWGEAEQQLRELIRNLDVEDCVHFVPPCGPLEVVEAARAYDVGLILHKPVTLNHELTLPNKLFDYLGAGLAIVAPNLPVFEEIIGSTGCGMTFSHDGSPSLQSVLDRIVSDRSGLQEMKRHAAEACHQYCWDVQGRKLIGVYRQVAGVGSA